LTDYVLGVDGGGTWTRSIIMDTEGNILGQGRSGPCNPLTIGLNQAYLNIIAASKEAQKLSAEEVRYSVFGIAGVERSKTKEQLIQLLSKEYSFLEIVSDTSSALSGAIGGTPGIAVIAGTGSNVYGLNEEGETARSGGWGWRIGDEGSGYTIGREGINAALKAHDLRGPKTTLTNKIIEKLNINEIEDIIDWVYAPDRQPKDIADLVPLVVESYRDGDTVASLILSEAGVELGMVTNSVIRKLNMKGGFKVACIGGVFMNGGAYNIAFEEVVRREAPHCELVSPRFSPTVGSALIALKKLGVSLDNEFLCRLEENLGAWNG
jgi:N-acetylglucosamine kinase-like BadF-type ATPase